jgi:type I restriction enzyme, R subunit
MELKNPADVNADIWKAFHQIETYKENIPDVFQFNEILVITDGSEARLGSLSSNAERYMQWRTIDGAALDPLGQFNELETLVRGVLPMTKLNSTMPWQTTNPLHLNWAMKSSKKLPTN